MPATITMWPPALVWPGFIGNAQTAGELGAFERRIREGLWQIVFATPLGATRPLVEGTFAMSASYNRSSPAPRTCRCSSITKGATS